MITAFIFNLVFSLIAIAAAFGCLRLFDKLLEVRFKRDHLPIIQKDPLALAIYRAALAFGVFFLMGSLFGS